MKLAVMEPLGVSKELLKRIAETSLKGKLDIVYYDTRTTDTQELIARGADAEIIIAANLPLNSEVINGCKKLKLLSVAFTGVDHIAMDACRERDIVVCNSAGYSTAAVSDLVFGMLISLYRNLNECNEAVRNQQSNMAFTGIELEKKKFGIIGTGAIGLRTAGIAQAFGCEVYAYSRTAKEVPGITNVSLEELISTCDVVSIHVPFNKTTKHLIDREMIMRMKPEAVLINTARGGIVDSEALAEALNEGRIAGACIDVFETEPPLIPSHPLLNCKNIVVTPHIAFKTREALEKRAEIVFDNVLKYLSGTPQNVMK